jgi:hypothetical protein
MAKKISIVFLIVFFPFTFFSQTLDSLKLKNIPISISGYVDAYYAYYTDSLRTGDFQKFPSVSPRSNQFALNTAQISFSYDAEKVRGLATFHFGDIPKSTWSSTYNSIMEAHAGVRVFKKLWLDVGFFRTHFGTENLLPKENFTSSVSVCTYYEPYYESGIRLNYNPNEKLAINILIINGYGIYEDNNNKKSVGMLITYILGRNGNIGYSNYIGDDSPKSDTVTHTRILQNLFLNYQINKLKIQIGGDYGIQKHSYINDNTKSATMYAGVASFRYELISKIAVYGRYEIFNDPQGFMSGVITDKNNMLTGYKLWGATLGVEYKPTENSYIRIEGRRLNMDKNQEIFHWNNENTNLRYEAMLNFGISF